MFRFDPFSPAIDADPFPGTRVSGADGDSFLRGPGQTHAILCGDRVVRINREMRERDICPALSPEGSHCRQIWRPRHGSAAPHRGVWGAAALAGFSPHANPACPGPSGAG